MLLALLLAPGNAAEQRVWAEAGAGVPGAPRFRDAVARLTPALRLPVFEAMLVRSRSAPAAERTQLVEWARRLMAADGHVGPLDRLHWLLMRHRLGDAPAAASRPGDASALGPQAAADFARFSAGLARCVPVAAADGAIAPAGRAWFERALAPWAAVLATQGGAAACCQVPEPEALWQALRALQAQSWMLRPVLVRAWTDALDPPGVGALDAAACDALCIATRLLDVPLPPPLAARYGDPRLG